jgi:hypothetical protein
MILSHPGQYISADRPPITRSDFAFPIRGMLLTCENRSSAKSRDPPSKERQPRTHTRALTRGSQTITSRAWPKASHTSDASCRHSFEQCKWPVQLLTVEEFRHAPTDAKRLAGVISLAAVIGGPHPHPERKLVEVTQGRNTFRQPPARQKAPAPARPDRRRACRHCPSGKSDFPVWPRQRNIPVFECPKSVFGNHHPVLHDEAHLSAFQSRKRTARVQFRSGLHRTGTLPSGPARRA